MCWILRESGIRLAKEGDKRSDMGKGGGPNPEQKGGGLHFFLSHTWDWTLVSVPRRLSCDS